MMIRKRAPSLKGNDLKVDPRTIDIVFGFVLFLLYFAILYWRIPASPLSSDSLLYANVGLNNIREHFILNRYFHVYLQKVFLEIAPSPIEGYRTLWALLVSLVLILTYAGARAIPSSHPMNGVLAMGFLLALPNIDKIAGILVVDLTATFISMLIINLYIFSAKTNHHNAWMILGIGTLIFLGFKTKETTLPVSIPVVIGLLYDENKLGGWSRLKTLALWLLGGLLIGSIFFAILNALFLKDALFGLRISDIKIFLSTYVSGAVEAEKISDSQNWFSAFWLRELYIPFLLYIAGGISQRDELPLAIRILWVIPVVATFFVIVSVGNAWGYEFRFIMPAIPIVAILASSTLRLKSEEQPSLKRNLEITGIALGAILLILITKRIAVINRWDWNFFVHAFLYPFLLSVILLTLFLQKHPFTASKLILGMVITGLVPGMITNAKQMLVIQPNFHIFQNTVYPLEAFSDKITFTPSTKMFIDTEVFSQEGMAPIVKNIDELVCLFNFYLHVNSKRDNFNFSKVSLEQSLELVNKKYDLVLMTTRNFQYIREHLTSKFIEQLYEIYEEPKGLFVLLTAR